MQVRRLDDEAQALRPIVSERDALQLRCAQEQVAGDALRADATAIREALATEQVARQAAEASATHAIARAQAFKELLAGRETISTDETSRQTSV